MEIDKQYNSKEVETKWYTLWESKGYFRPATDRATGQEPRATEKNVSRVPCPVSRSYVIVIPPPNVTGILHMGHALNSAIQDILIRWNRMKGADTLWACLVR